MMTGKSASGVPVLEDTDDMRAPIAMTPNIRLFSPRAQHAHHTLHRDELRQTCGNMAALMTNIPAKRTTVELDT